jgi:hypothetical protein
VTYEPWHARVGLSSAYEPNDAKRFADLRLVIQHIAHHRGWRNPWWHFERLALEFKEDSSPTAEFEVVRERAAKLLGLSPDELSTVGQIGWAASNPKFALRPRHLDMSTQAAKNRQTSDNIIVPANPYLGLIEAPGDLQTAALAWAEGEILNVEMYDQLIEQATDDRLIRVLENLRRASLEQHLPAFEAAAANGGTLDPEEMGVGSGLN